MPYKLPEEGPVITHQLHSFKTSHHSNSDHDNHCDTDTVQRLQDSVSDYHNSNETENFITRNYVIVDFSIIVLEVYLHGG